MEEGCGLKDNYGLQVGCGIYKHQKKTYRIFRHFGNNNGYQNILIYIPEKDISIIFLSNTRGGIIKNFQEKY
jgi:hypothetical protein